MTGNQPLSDYYDKLADYIELIWSRNTDNIDRIVEQLPKITNEEYFSIKNMIDIINSMVKQIPYDIVYPICLLYLVIQNYDISDYADDINIIDRYVFLLLHIDQDDSKKMSPKLIELVKTLLSDVKIFQQMMPITDGNTKWLQNNYDELKDSELFSDNLATTVAAKVSEKSFMFFYEKDPEVDDSTTIAAYEGGFRKVIDICEKQNPYSPVCLQEAIMNHHNDLAIETINKYGESIVWRSMVETFNYKMIDYHIKKGNINKKDDFGTTLICAAVKKENIFLVKYLLEKGADPCIDIENDSIVFQAIENIEIAKLILPLIKDLNFEYKGTTPFLYSLLKKKFEVSKILIDIGCDVVTNNNSRMDYLTTCITLNQIDIARAILQKGFDPNTMFNGKSALSNAIEDKNEDFVDLLLEFKADPNITDDEENYTPLVYAAQSGLTNIVAKLLKHGAKIDHQIESGATPLIMAAFCGHLDVVKVLVENGASIEMTSSDGRTPIYAAAMGGNLKVIKYLEEKGANLQATRNDGKTPFFIACQEGHFDIAKYLITKKETDINVTICDGLSVLFAALFKGNMKMAEFLLENNIDINKSMKGLTPLYYCIKKGYDKLAEKMIKMGANLDATYDGESIREAALSLGYYSLIKLMDEMKRK